MTSAFSWQNYCPALPCFILYSKAKFACYSRCFLNSYFCIPVPYKEKDIFWGCQFQKVFQVFIKLFNFRFFSIAGQSIDLNYCDMNGLPWKHKELILSFLRLHLISFWTLFFIVMATPFLLRDSCPQQQIEWSSELNSPISVHFSSLIAKVSVFTLAISCLNTCNLP